jgi:mono/diheme cytochrome c family protein
MLRGNPEGVEDVWQKTAANSDVLRLVPKPGETVPSQVVPEEPNNDETVRKVMLDKFPSLNAPPVLDATGMFQRGLRVFVRNCAECHEPPFFTTAVNLELTPELPDPIAKLHGYTLVRNAFADAFKERMIANGVPHGVGVNDAVRPLLGNRRFYFDQERLPDIEALVGPLLIELMRIPDKRPTTFLPALVFPGAGKPDRKPMITWTGTRPPLEFAPSPQPGEDPIDPYAFYDQGYYNLGISEPRYDWGVWAYSGSEDSISIVQVQRLLAETPLAILQARGVSEKAVKELIEIVEKELKESKDKAPGSASIPSLGTAYRLPKLKQGRDTAVSQQERNEEILRVLETAPEFIRQDAQALLQYITTQGVDHSANRAFLDYAKFGHRKDIHFFKRARRMVMTEETWGHRKPFISDNELMGWGAFKTPSLRNIALTEPYMHNGRYVSLRQVIEFYSFDNPDLIPADPVSNPDLHPEMGRLPLNHDGRIDRLSCDDGCVPDAARPLVAFLAARATPQGPAFALPAASPMEEWGRFEGQVVARWEDDGRTMTLVEPFAYVDPREARWPAPAGSVVNGASIPRPFWSLFGGPFSGEFRDASVVHDVACETRDRPWRAVHLMFYEACRCGGVGAVTAKTMYYAVFHYGPRWQIEERTTIVAGQRQTERTIRDETPAAATEAEVAAIARYFQTHDVAAEDIPTLEIDSPDR